jgi:hypothetical protein
MIQIVTGNPALIYNDKRNRAGEYNKTVDPEITNGIICSPCNDYSYNTPSRDIFEAVRPSYSVVI